MIDFSRRRFLFGLAAAPLAVPVVTHFIMPKLVTGDDVIMELVNDLQHDPIAGYGGASTTFGEISEATRLIWAQEVWRQARDASFFYGNQQFV
jgi:hypothetical protein